MLLIEIIWERNSFHWTDIQCESSSLMTHLCLYLLLKKAKATPRQFRTWATYFRKNGGSLPSLVRLNQCRIQLWWLLWFVWSNGHVFRGTIFWGGVQWPKIASMPLDSYDVAWSQQRFSVNLLLTGVARLFAIFFVNYWASPQWLFDLYSCPSQTKQNAERLFCRATELCGANFVTETSLCAVLWFLVFSGSMLHQR